MATACIKETQLRARGPIVIKPEPIMLLILPIILSRISHNFHPLFFIYYFSNLIMSLVKLHMAADK